MDIQNALIWNGYIAMLKSGNIRLFNVVDELVWIHSKNGKYTPTEGYLQLLKDRTDVEISWLWKAVWKFKFPLKSKI